MIKRAGIEHSIKEALNRTPIVAIIGPRQCGKTTIARHFSKGRRVTFFDLEDPADFAALEKVSKEILA